MEVKNRYTGEIIMEIENLREADLRGANLTSYYSITLSDEQISDVSSVLITTDFDSERRFWLDQLHDAPDELKDAIDNACFNEIKKMAVRHRVYIESKITAPALRRLLTLVYFR